MKGRLQPSFQAAALTKTSNSFLCSRWLWRGNFLQATLVSRLISSALERSDPGLLAKSDPRAAGSGDEGPHSVDAAETAAKSKCGLAAVE